MSDPNVQSNQNLICFLIILAVLYFVYNNNVEKFSQDDGEIYRLVALLHIAHSQDPTPNNTNVPKIQAYLNTRFTKVQSDKSLNDIRSYATYLNKKIGTTLTNI